MNTLDLTAYLDRVNWHGPTERTYPTLAGLLDAHIAHIPFENFDVLLGRPVRLDLEGIQSKLVKCRRGGYCFEHATLFAAVLERLGFEPVRHAARVTVFQPLSEAAQTCSSAASWTVLASLSIRGSDPSGQTCRCRWTSQPAGRSLNTPDGSRKRSLGDARHPRWGGNSRVGFHTEIQCPVDFEMANHFTATHPTSRFVNGILASAVTGEGRVNVINRDVTVLRGRTAEKSTLPDRLALRVLLAKHFGFDLPEAETIRVPSVPDWR